MKAGREGGREERAGCGTMAGWREGGNRGWAGERGAVRAVSHPTSHTSLLAGDPSLLALRCQDDSSANPPFSSQIPSVG